MMAVSFEINYTATCDITTSNSITTPKRFISSEYPYLELRVYCSPSFQEVNTTQQNPGQTLRIVYDTTSSIP